MGWSRERYVVQEANLRRALDDGIDSIVLSSEIPESDRSFVAEMLNQTHGRKWRCGEDGKVEIEDGEATQASQFVALSKVLDATELGLLVRIKMGVAEVDVSDCGPDGDWHALNALTSVTAATNSAAQSTTPTQARAGNESRSCNNQSH